MKSKKPPDLPFYKCIKCPIKNIIKDDNALYRIKDAVIKTNKIIISTYQFMKLYCLHELKVTQSLPIIDKNFVNKCIMVVSNGDNRGPPLKCENKILFEKLSKFYDKEFKQLCVGEKQSSKKINQILNYSIVVIITSYENNIKCHFINRLFRYINKVFHDDNKDTKKETIKELKKVKNDILNNTLKSDKKYHKWIKKNRTKLIPKEYNKSIPYDVKKEPLKYFPFMIHINNQLQKLEMKQFHCFPLRKDVVPKSIELDTAGLLELMIDNDSKKYRNGKNAIEQAKKELWGKFFKTDNCVFKHGKNYIFDYSIKTDGISISIRFIRKDKYGKKVRQQKNIDNNDFIYIDNLKKKEIKNIKQNCNVVYIDPNKGNLIYCVDNNNKFFRYTRKQRLRETQRLKHQKIINNFKDENNLKEIETSISDKNSKTCNYVKFKQYLKAKNKANDKLFEHYEKEFIRKLKLRTYINTQRSESKLINNMKKIYSENKKEIVICHGDWGISKQMKHIISTPQIGMKRMLKKYFKVYNVDEFRTSCLDNRTEEKNNNAFIKRKNGKNKKLHSVLVSTIPKLNSSECKTSYQNRDRNSVLNIRKIVKMWFDKKERPYRYRRNIKL
jgi:hypothetical protein